MSASARRTLDVSGRSLRAASTRHATPSCRRRSIAHASGSGNKSKLRDDEQTQDEADETETDAVHGVTRVSYQLTID